MKLRMLQVTVCILTLVLGLAWVASAAEEVIFYDTHGGANWQEFYLRWVFPQFEQKTGIKVVYVPASYTELSAKMQGWPEGYADIDVIDLHPANAAALIQAGNIHLANLLERTDQIPNITNVDPEFVDNVLGYPTDGMSVPLWLNYYAFLYNGAKIQDPPGSFHLIHDWAVKGKFSDAEGGHLGLISPAASSAGGRKFIWSFLHAYGCNFTFLDKPDPEDPSTWVEDSTWEPGWDALREMVEAEAFFREPASSGAAILNQFLKEEVWATVYALDYFLWSMEAGRVPDTSATSSLSEGVPISFTYLGVLENAPHQEAANELVNYLLSDAFQSQMFEELWLYPVVGLYDQLPTDRYGALTPTWSEVKSTGVILGPPDSLLYIQAVGLKKLGLVD